MSRTRAKGGAGTPGSTPNKVRAYSIFVEKYNTQHTNPFTFAG